MHRTRIRQGEGHVVDRNDLFPPHPKTCERTGPKKHALNRDPQREKGRYDQGESQPGPDALPESSAYRVAS